MSLGRAVRVAEEALGAISARGPARTTGRSAMPDAAPSEPARLLRATSGPAPPGSTRRGSGPASGRPRASSRPRWPSLGEEDARRRVLPGEWTVAPSRRPRRASPPCRSAEELRHLRGGTAGRRAARLRGAALVRSRPSRAVGGAGRGLREASAALDATPRRAHRARATVPPSRLPPSSFGGADRSAAKRPGASSPPS